MAGQYPGMSAGGGGAAGAGSPFLMQAQPGTGPFTSQPSGISYSAAPHDTAGYASSPGGPAAGGFPGQPQQTFSGYPVSTMSGYVSQAGGGYPNPPSYSQASSTYNLAGGGGQSPIYSQPQLQAASRPQLPAGGPYQQQQPRFPAPAQPGFPSPQPGQPYSQQQQQQPYQQPASQPHQMAATSTASAAVMSQATSGTPTPPQTPAPSGPVQQAPQQQQQQQQQTRDYNAATLCRYGQEYLQDLVNRAQELFNQLKLLQPPNGTVQGANSSADKQNKIRQQLDCIKMLFRRLRYIYEKVMESCAGLEFTPIESLVPYKDEPEARLEGKKTSEAYRQAMEEYNEIREQVQVRNRYLKDIIDQLRNIIWDVNTMLAMRCPS